MVNGTCTCIFGGFVGIPINSTPSVREAYRERYYEAVTAHRAAQVSKMVELRAARSSEFVEFQRTGRNWELFLPPRSKSLDLCGFCREMTSESEGGHHPLNSDVYLKLMSSTEMLVCQIVKLYQEEKLVGGVADEIAVKRTLLDKKIKKFEDVYEEFVCIGGADELWAAIFRVNTLPIDKWTNDLCALCHMLCDNEFDQDSSSEEDEMVGQFGFEYLGNGYSVNGYSVNIPKKVGRMIGDILVQ